MKPSENALVLSWIILVIVAALVFIAAVVSPCAAHDAQRPDLDQWFMSLQNNNGTPCCDGSDAKHLSNVEWRVKDGHYQVFLENDWRDVPDRAVIKQANLDGQTLVWPYYIDGKLIGVRCFLPGAGS